MRAARQNSANRSLFFASFERQALSNLLAFGFANFNARTSLPGAIKKAPFRYDVTDGAL